MFLANYADGLSDLDSTRTSKSFVEREKTASFLSVPAPHTFHIVHSDAETTSPARARRRSTVRINAGFFVLARDLRLMNPGEELVLSRSSA